MWSIRVIVFSLVVSISMCVAPMGASPAYGATLYKDVASTHWAYDNISRLSESGLLTGYPDGTFLPSKDVTYGEFLKMALLCSGKKDPGKTFENKAGLHWASPYYEEGLSKGYYTKHRIGLESLAYPIPRGDMSLVLSEMLGDWDIKDYPKIQNKITDVDYRNPHEYHIVKIYAAGILTGYPDGSFRPKGTLNRAEAAAVITRFMEVKKKQLFPVPDPPPGTNMLRLEDLVPNHKDEYKLKDVEYYWITDNDPYTYKKMRNYYGTAGLYIYPEDRSRTVVFIVGDKVLHTSNALAILYWETGAEEGSDLPDFDYIGVYPRCSDTMMLIPWPFR